MLYLPSNLGVHVVHGVQRGQLEAVQAERACAPRDAARRVVRVAGGESGDKGLRTILRQ